MSRDASMAIAGAARSRMSASSSVILLKVGGGIVLLTLWEIVVRAWAPAYVARPTGIARVFFGVLADEQFLSGAAATLWAVVEGLLISVVAGTLIGAVMGRVSVVEQGLRYYVNSLFATPMVAILPLVTLWFGYSADTRLAVVVFASFFSIVINACDGARSVPIEYIEVARSFRAKPLSALFDVLLPSSLPYLLAGMRLAAGRALIGAVVSEFFISIPGLGFYILYNSRVFKHNEAMVAVIVLVAAGIGFDALVKWLTRRFMPWGRRV